MYKLKYSDCVSARERFEAKIDRTDGPDACHPFTSRAQFADGYGVMSLKVGGKHRGVRLHRIAYVLATEESIHSRELIDHFECSNPGCCNPAHLRKTDAKGNAETRIKKANRGRRREFSDQSIMEIRRRWAVGDSTSKLIEAYQVTSAAISQIVHGKSYKDLPILSRPPNFNPRGGTPKLMENDVAEIKTRLLAGEARTHLSREFGVSGTHIGRIARGEAWKYVGPLPNEYLELIAAD